MVTTRAHVSAYLLVGGSEHLGAVFNEVANNHGGPVHVHDRLRPPPVRYRQARIPLPVLLIGSERPTEDKGRGATHYLRKIGANMRARLADDILLTSRWSMSLIMRATA